MGGVVLKDEPGNPSPAPEGDPGSLLAAGLRCAYCSQLRDITQKSKATENIPFHILSPGYLLTQEMECFPLRVKAMSSR